MNLFKKTRGCLAPFIFARTNTCLRGISGYSGIPDHIEIRWANEHHHRVVFCRYPLWRLTRNTRNSRLCNMYALARTRD